MTTSNEILDAIALHYAELRKVKYDVAVLFDEACAAYNSEHPEHLMLVHRLGSTSSAITIYDRGALARATEARERQEGRINRLLGG